MKGQSLIWTGPSNANLKGTMKRPLRLAIAGLFLGHASVQAQSVGKMLVDDFGGIARDVGSVFLSPFRGSGRDYLIAGGVLAGSAALSAFDDNVDRWALANEGRGVLKSLDPVRSGGDFYSLNQATPYVIGLYGVALATKHRGIRDGIMGCVSSYTANTLLRHQVWYRVLGRDRPDTARDRLEGEFGPPAKQGDQYRFSGFNDSWGAHSFPGGHVATIATCASFFMHRYEAKYFDPALVALVAAVGVGRIADRGHWASDQVVGVAYGYAIGREIARRQLRRLARERTDGSVSIPTGGTLFDVGRDGVRLGWQSTF